MFFPVEKNNEDRELAAGVHQMAGLNALPSKKSRDRVQGSSGENIFAPQQIENFHVQRTTSPLVGFIEVNRDLHRHEHQILQQTRRRHASDCGRDAEQIVAEYVDEHERPLSLLEVGDSFKSIA